MNNSSSSFQTSKAQELLDYKLSTMKKLQSFNDETIPGDSTLLSLKSRRMTVAKQMMGKIGANVNIEPALFLVWGCNIFVGDNVYIHRQ